MSSKSRKRYEELIREIAEHDHRYHVLAAPAVSDAEYDRLFRELRSIEAAHPDWIRPESPTQRVGAPLPEGTKFARRRHAVPMISIESLFDAEEVAEFHARLLRALERETDEAPRYACEPKWDGVSASLTYEEGRFVRGLSRGDGVAGEDLSRNLKAVGGVPLRLRAARPPALLEVRGEVMLPLARFDALNEELAAGGRPPFANPRNATAGTLKRLDPAVVAARGLRFLAWEVARLEGAAFATHSEQMQAVRDWGFPISPHRALADGPEGITAFHDRLEARRGSLEYEMDGVVAKVDQLELRQLLGSRARTPRWACAYKFAPREETTTLAGIEIQVGRTGRLTPRAVLEPVTLGGTTVRHATLHNAKYITERDIRVGDRVVVRRAGDVIPQVVGPMLAARKGRRLRRFVWPERCPACQGEVLERGEYRLCVNVECPAQLQRRILHLASREALRIEGLGEKAVAQLAAAGLLGSLEGVFDLDYRRVAALERWGATSAENLRGQIDRARRPEWARLLFGLGIPDVGLETARALAAMFPGPPALQAAAAAADWEERLTAVEGVGPEVAASVRAFFHEPHNRRALERMLASGVEPRAPERGVGRRKGVSGKSFVLTGTLSAPRVEVRARIEALGGKVSSTVSKKTDFVVVGESPGSKAVRAEELGVPTLDEAGLNKLLGKG